MNNLKNTEQFTDCMYHTYVLNDFIS